MIENVDWFVRFFTYSSIQVKFIASFIALFFFFIVRKVIMKIVMKITTTIHMTIPSTIHLKMKCWFLFGFLLLSFWFPFALLLASFWLPFGFLNELIGVSLVFFVFTNGDYAIGFQLTIRRFPLRLPKTKSLNWSASYV